MRLDPVWRYESARREFEYHAWLLPAVAVLLLLTGFLVTGTYWWYVNVAAQIALIVFIRKSRPSRR